MPLRALREVEGDVMRGTYYSEWDPYAAAWLRNLIAAGHLPAGDVDERSILDVRGDDLRGYGACHFFAGIGGWPHALRLAGVPDDWPIWTGSCPCQPFSVAGAGAGTADERHLWPAFRRLIEECRPATVFGEQVAGKAGRLWLTGVRADLEELGYAVGAADLAAASVGAPHIRQRLYWMAKSNEGGWRAGISDLHARESDAQGSSDGLAHAEHAERGTEHQEYAESHRRNRPGGSGPIGGLAHADETGQRIVGSGGLPGDRDASHGADADRCGQACGLANTSGERVRTGRGEDAGATGSGEGEGPQRERLRADAGDACGLGDTDDAGLERRREFARERACQCTPRTPGADHWSHSILIPCGDGKARRIKSGLPPLAYGVPGRVGKLRAAGNAIVPPLAVEFVKAALAAAGGGA